MTRLVLEAGRYSPTICVVTHCVDGRGQLTGDGTTGGDTERCDFAKGAQCSEWRCMLVQMKSDMALQGDLPGETIPALSLTARCPASSFSSRERAALLKIVVRIQ